MLKCLNSLSSMTVMLCALESFISNTFESILLKSTSLKTLPAKTEYEWKVRSLCTDDTSKWVTGPHFSTAAAFASVGTTTGLDSKIEYRAVSATVMPNPNTGNFTIQMQLPKDNVATTLQLFNSFGVKIWQENLGIVSGTFSKNVYLENRLPSGIYVLVVQRSDGHYTTKIVVNK